MWTARILRARAYERAGSSRSNTPPASVALGQAEHALGDIAQDQLFADRRDARDHDLAQEALDMELLGVAVAAMGQDGALAGLVGGAGAEILGGVRFRAAFLAGVVEPG